MVCFRGIALMLLSSLSVYASASGITYHGRILNPDGSAVTDSAVQFQMSIYSPNSPSCLMYQEVQTKNLSSTSGAFSITINDGSGTGVVAPIPFDQVFANTGSLNLSGCLYSPVNGDTRTFNVSFKTSTMSSWEPLPSQSINYAPFAVEAKQITGFPGGTLLRAVDGSGNPTA